MASASNKPPAPAGGGVTKLSDGDLDRIAKRLKPVIVACIKAELPKAMRSELLRCGLATASDDDALAAQRAFAFLFKMSDAAGTAEGVVWRSVLRWAVGSAGGLMLVGAGAFLHRFVT